MLPKLHYILLFVFILSCPVVKAQKRKQPSHRLDIRAGIGAIYYVGDLKDDQLPNGKFISPFPALSLHYFFKNTFSLELGYFKSQLKGADKWGRSNPGRDFRFRSPIEDVYFLIRYELINRRGNRNFGVGILGGVGHFWFRPEIYNGEWVEAQGLGTEGQYLDSKYNDPYRLDGLNLKYGLEFSRSLGLGWTLDVYWTYTHTFTDYLDDVSGRYPDLADVLASENGEYLASFVYRYIDGHLPESGGTRGNPKLNDGYVNIGVGLRKTIFGSYLIKRQLKKNCDAYN